MGGEEVFGFGDVAKVLALGAMPWLNYLKPLRWHLRTLNFNPVPIFNSIATICAALISFLYFKSDGDLKGLFILDLKWLLPVFIIPATAYLALFLGYRESVEKGSQRWPLLAAFLVYIALFCSLAFVAGNLEFRRTFKVVQGTVVDARLNKKGIEGARVNFIGEGRDLGGDETGTDGSFRIAVKRDDDDKMILVTRDGFEDFQEQVGKLPRAEYLIPLKREVRGEENAQ